MSRQRWSAKRQLIARLIREMRKASGLSQQELALSTDFGQSDLSRIETSERAVELQEIETLCEACGTTLNAFIKRYIEQA